MRGGEISDLEAISEVIGKTVQAAEREAGLSLSSVTVVLPRQTHLGHSDAINHPFRQYGKPRDMRRLMSREQAAR